MSISFLFFMFNTFLSGHEGEFVVRLLFCLLGGLVIGIEREAKGKNAGISTHSLVIGGSMLFTLISIYLAPNDPARIAAQVVTGVGFLGAGIILKNDEGKVTNLTTAASIWFSAAIGMAIGVGWDFIALIAIVYAALVPRIPNFGKKLDPLHKEKD